MPTIEKRQTKGGVRWRARIRLQNMPPASRTFLSKADAYQWAYRTEARFRQERASGVRSAPQMPMRDVINRYVTEIIPRYSKPQPGRRQHLRWWQNQIGHHPLFAVSLVLIIQHRDRLHQEMTCRGRQRSAATVNRYLASLSHVLSVAVKEWGWLEQSPMKRVPHLRETSGRTRFLSDEERRRLLSACRRSASPDLHLAVVLALSTGARKMETMSLRWSDIDFERACLVLSETKNGEPRVLPLPNYVLNLLKRRQRQASSALVFPGRGDVHRPVNLRTAWESALRAAAITDFRWHDLRHSTASYLAMNGATMIELSEVLGHKTLGMVKRYAHCSISHRARLMERMSKRIFGA